MSSYDPERALDDLPHIKHAERLFLNSQMLESEQYCLEKDPKKEHLYLTSGYCLIQCFKALLSYEDEDIKRAMQDVKHGNTLAAAHRAPAAPIVSRLSGLVWDSAAANIRHIKSMTNVQRHAELLYAETTFAKALLGIVSSGSWLTFLTEALSFRTTINIYMALDKFLRNADVEAAARGLGAQDPSIDKDLRSGIELGVGASNMILSLLPSKILNLVELLGYKGDREGGLALLAQAGGWKKGEREPGISHEEEGARRCLADIALLCFNLVISSFTHRGVDIEMAQNILDWNLKHYPNGVFYLFAQGRLRLLRSQPASAIESYSHGLEAQNQYRSLYFISYWEIALCSLSTWDLDLSLSYWRKLEAEATWSKATYTYGMAACLLQLGGEDNVTEAARLMSKVPGLCQRIAGKSIPVEKFVARKARKFKQQTGHLLLPALEIGYMLQSLLHSPRSTLADKILPVVDAALQQLPSRTSSENYWDDYCLAHLLRGVSMRYVAFPDRDAIVDPHEEVRVDDEFAISEALTSLELVIENSQKIILDHYIIYHAHFELGCLSQRMGNDVKARHHLDLVFSGKALEGAGKRRGKYSMQSALFMRTMAALETMDTA